MWCLTQDVSRRACARMAMTASTRMETWMNLDHLPKHQYCVQWGFTSSHMGICMGTRHYDVSQDLGAIPDFLSNPYILTCCFLYPYYTNTGIVIWNYIQLSLYSSRDYYGYVWVYTYIYISISSHDPLKSLQ